MEPWEVDLEIDRAVTEGFSQAEAGAALEAGREVLEEGDLTKFDFPQFRSELIDRGFSMAEVRAAWSQLRDLGEVPEGSREEHPKATGASDVDVQDALVLEETGEASEIAVNVFAEPLVEGELQSLLLDSQEARGIVDDLDEAPTVPFYVVQTEDGFEVRPLEEAAERYL